MNSAAKLLLPIPTRFGTFEIDAAGLEAQIRERLPADAESFSFRGFELVVGETQQIEARYWYWLPPAFAGFRPWQEGEPLNNVHVIKDIEGQVFVLALPRRGSGTFAFGEPMPLPGWE